VHHLELAVPVLLRELGERLVQLAPDPLHQQTTIRRQLDGDPSAIALGRPDAPDRTELLESIEKWCRPARGDAERLGKLTGAERSDPAQELEGPGGRAMHTEAGGGLVLEPIGRALPRPNRVDELLE